MVYVGGYHDCIGRCSVHWRDIDSICVLSCTCEFFCNTLNTRLTGSLTINNIIHKTQICFFENRRTSDHVFTLKSAIYKHVNTASRGRIHGCLVDFKKAYDSVWHKRLFTKLGNLNVNSVFINIIKDIYSRSVCAVKVMNSRTDFFPCKSGVRQGVL